ncbi:MAG: hypothetical protein ACRC2U_17440 [Aeromonas sp.]
MIQLNGIDLPDDMTWPNELSHTPVVQSLEHAVTGDPVLQFGVQKGGRPIHLVSDGAWLNRAQLDALRATLTSSPPLLLTLAAGVYKVTWDHQNTPIDATPISTEAEPWLNPAAKYDATLRFITLE